MGCIIQNKSITTTVLGGSLDRVFVGVTTQNGGRAAGSVLAAVMGRRRSNIVSIDILRFMVLF